MGDERDMKRKFLPKLVKSLLFIAVLFIYTSGVAYASVVAYNTWAGTESYNATSSNLDNLGELLSSNKKTIEEKDSSLLKLSVDLENLELELGLLSGLLGNIGLRLSEHNGINLAQEEYVNVLDETLDSIGTLQSTLDTAQTEVTTLNEQLVNEKSTKETIQLELTNKEQELEQAKKDMEAIEIKTNELLETYSIPK